jgi:hypothetical protein
MKKPKDCLFRSLKKFLKNERAVLGLPLRLTVTLIIGVAALSFILLYILNPCLFPGKLVVSIDPMVNIIAAGSNEEDFDITVLVKDYDGYPVSGANVIIDGLGGAGASTTDVHGVTIISITARLESGVNEGYLDINVEASCHEKFSENRMIKVVRGS